MKSGQRPDFSFDTRGFDLDSCLPAETASYLIAPNLERATGFASERSELLDVKSGQRPDFSFDTRDAGSNLDSSLPAETASYSIAPNLERATGFEPATFSVEG